MSRLQGLDRFDIDGEGSVLALQGIGADWVAAAFRAHRENADADRTLKRNLGTLVTRISTSGFPPAQLSEMPAEVVVKEAPRKSGPLGLTRLLSLRSQFRRDFEIGQGLAQLGVRSPRALACSLRPVRSTEILVTELVADAIPLRDLLWLGEKVVRDPTEREELFQRIGAWLRRLHETGVWQRDMKPSNVLVVGNDFVLVDITVVRLFGGPLGEERRQRNLAQILDLTPDLDGQPRLPLLRSYLGSEGESPSTLERWAEQVHRLIEARRDHRESRCGFRFVDEEHFRRARAP